MTRTRSRAVGRTAAWAGLAAVVGDPAEKRAGVGTVALLGTAFTMEHPFYRERVTAAGIEVLVPEADDRAVVGGGVGLAGGPGLLGVAGDHEVGEIA